MASLRRLARMCRDLAKQHVEDPDVPVRAGWRGRVRQVGADGVGSVPCRIRKEPPRDGRLPQRDARYPWRIWT